MKDIIRISIKNEAGFSLPEDAYRDRLTISRETLRYEYVLAMETESSRGQKWAYKTNSPHFQKLFDQAVERMAEILDVAEKPAAMDTGAITFRVTYADYTKESRVFWNMESEFSELFVILWQMVPVCETVPEVIWITGD